MTISATEHPHKTLDVLGSTLAYVELGGDAGNGDPIIFQHGNPTSSYLWRNIMPGLQDKGRCIAIDLIGMGHSDKLADSGPHQYTLKTHIDYFDAALDALGVKNNVTMVIHDWGSAIGFDWANRHRDQIKGLCYMEAIVKPMTWDQWPALSRKIFQGFRSDSGESMVLEKNVFVERVLPGSVIRDMTDEEMQVYRRPFTKPGESRRPTLTWPRQIPLDGEPADVVALVQSYADWLSECDIPKLFINADPGAILIGEQREFCRRWPNQQEVTVSGNHFIQEDSPREISDAIHTWMSTL